MGKDLNKIFAENLIYLRKKKKMTQIELADKFDYSDKTVSKWENGVTIPSVDVLMELSTFFNVSLDYFVKEHDEKEKIKITRDASRMVINKIIITLLSILLVWLLAVVIYVSCIFITGEYFWTLYIWAVPVSSIVAIIFKAIWWPGKTICIFISILIWSLITAVCLQFLTLNLWLLYLIGIPAQISVILASQFK